MKTILTIALLLTPFLCYCRYDDSTFINKCYFSDDGKWALVSELDFTRLKDDSDRSPVFGLYTLGRNQLNNHIVIAGDSIYFFSKNLYPVDLSNNIDSVFEKNSFLSRYHFSEGLNMTQYFEVKITDNFLSKVNTIELLKLKQHSSDSFTAASTKYFNYYLEIYCDGKIIFRDTIFNSYGDKKHLIKGLNEVNKIEIMDNQGCYLGRRGYGTRVYANKDKTCYFIRAKYDTTNYAVVTRYWKELNDITGKIDLKKSVLGQSEDPKEIRVLTKKSL